MSGYGSRRRNATGDFNDERFGLDFPKVEDEDDRFPVVDSQSGIDAQNP